LSGGDRHCRWGISDEISCQLLGYLLQEFVVWTG
jgi:hypothetical protein